MTPIAGGGEIEGKPASVRRGRANGRTSERAGVRAHCESHRPEQTDASPLTPTSDGIADTRRSSDKLKLNVLPKPLARALQCLLSERARASTSSSSVLVHTSCRMSRPRAQFAYLRARRRLTGCLAGWRNTTLIKGPAYALRLRAPMLRDGISARARRHFLFSNEHFPLPTRSCFESSPESGAGGAISTSRRWPFSAGRPDNARADSTQLDSTRPLAATLALARNLLLECGCCKSGEGIFCASIGS